MVEELRAKNRRPHKNIKSYHFTKMEVTNRANVLQVSSYRGLLCACKNNFTYESEDSVGRTSPTKQAGNRTSVTTQIHPFIICSIRIYYSSVFFAFATSYFFIWTLLYIGICKINWVGAYYRHRKIPGTDQISC